MFASLASVVSLPSESTNLNESFSYSYVVLLLGPQNVDEAPISKLVDVPPTYIQINDGEELTPSKLVTGSNIFSNSFISPSSSYCIKLGSGWKSKLFLLSSSEVSWYSDAVGSSANPFNNVISTTALSPILLNPLSIKLKWSINLLCFLGLFSTLL